CGQGTYWPYIF
nr:immunoglobulin light chain junction region [Macaca mulatta]